MTPVSCPNCHQSFEIDPALLGRHGRCDHCQTKFLLSAAEPQGAQTQTDKQNGKQSGKNLFVIAGICLAAVAGGLYIAQHQSSETPETTANTDPDKHAVPATTQATSPLSKNSKPEPPAIANPAISPSTKKPALPASASALGQTFPVQTQFKTVDIRAYLKTYPKVYDGWMPAKSEQSKEALKWGSHLGPLGVRIRSHAPQLQGRPAFAAIVPNCLRSEDGQLALAAAEVVSIAPGSPADNHLQVGDFIIGIEGEDLKSGNEYRPEWQTMHKDARELQLMLGEKIDQAQNRGDIRLTVMRYPETIREVFAKKLQARDGRTETKAIAVNPGDEIHLIVDPQGHNESDHFAWLSPRLTGNGQSALDLSDQNQIKADQETTGWGKISRNKDIAGNALEENGIGVHAPSTIVFTVPAGYSHFQTAMKATKHGGQMKASIKIQTQQTPLPVRNHELWAGKGGNKSIGLQSFDVQVPAEGFISLVSDKFDQQIHGDGTSWFDVTLEGDYGTKRMLSLPCESAQAGYGRATFTTDKPTSHNGIGYAEALNLHAHGTATWRIPKGTRRIKGSFSALSYGKVQPRIVHTNLARPLTGIHRQKTIQLRFPIGKTGSFSASYPKNCAKTEITVSRHTDWLAAQQRADGTWPRLAGYTTSGWDTSWCALALMSGGEDKYRDQIKRAAYQIAYAEGPSEWTAERAMRVVFLAEYYLDTEDRAILAGLQSAYVQLAACAKTDFMAGHKVNGFGYGIAGQHYGTGHLALAMALAAQTPIAVDRKLVDGIIRHAGEVCVNGTYAYGRGRRMARDGSRRHSGGNAMVGPGMLGAMIGGGHQSSIQEALERWSASVGDGDNSHATSSLAFIFSSLAMACGDEEVFLKHMQHFRYKMTLDDNWQGGILKSAFSLDLQSGEGVTSTWIRSAGSILVLNALKKNLTITGKRKNFAKQYIPTEAVSEWGGQVHSYYLRNWCLAKELLGHQAPDAIEHGIIELEQLPRTTGLVPATKKIILKRAPKLIELIANNRQLKDTQRAYAIELLSGLDFRLFTSTDGKHQNIDLRVNHPLHQLNWPTPDQASPLDHPDFPLQAKIAISGDNLDKVIHYDIPSNKGFHADSGELKATLQAQLKNPGKTEFKGKAEISFSLGKNTITYNRPLWFNSEFAHSNNINLRRLNLQLKVAPRAYFQSQPLMIAGRAFDCMYPKERMLEVKGPRPGNISIHEGDNVLVNIASENMVCAWVLSMTFPEMTQVKVAKAKEQRAIHGSLSGDEASLYDWDDSTGCQIQPANGKSIIEYDFGKAITLNGLDVRYQHGGYVRISYKKGDRWIPLIWDRYSPHTGHNPRFPDTLARQWRVELRPRKTSLLSTLSFYHNTNRIDPQPTYIQAEAHDSYPATQAK